MSARVHPGTAAAVRALEIDQADLRRWVESLGRASAAHGRFAHGPSGHAAACHHPLTEG